MARTLAFGVLTVLVASASACRGGRMEAPYAMAIAGGSPAAGRAAIDRFDCGACHTIPGVRGARGTVGPPLFFWSRRAYIAGELPNTPANLMQWVRNPQSVEPTTAMPALGLSEQDARDVAAFLYTLE